MARQTIAGPVRIQIEIMAGWEWGDSRTKVQDIQDNRKAWEEIAADIRDM